MEKARGSNPLSSTQIRGCLATGGPVREYGPSGTVSSMKTTVELPDSLVRAAQELARQEHTTLRALVEAGLRAVLAEREQAQAFTLRDASVDGEGLAPAFRDAGWDQVREAIYGRAG
jgi:predicted transcriptional regulator